MGGSENTDVFKKISELSKPGECKKENCDLHGEYVSSSYFKDHWSGCPVCSDIEMEKHNDEENQKMIEENRLNRIEYGLNSANIPERFKNCTFDNYKIENTGQGKASKITKKYYSNFKEIQKTGSSLFCCGS